MKGLVLNRIREYLLVSTALADFLDHVKGDHMVWFDTMMMTLEKASDKQLLALYDKLKAGVDIVPHGDLHDAGMLTLTIHRRMIGGMDLDGIIHT